MADEIGGKLAVDYHLPPVPSRIDFTVQGCEGVEASVPLGAVDRATLDAVAQRWLSAFYAGAGRRSDWVLPDPPAPR